VLRFIQRRTQVARYGGIRWRDIETWGHSRIRQGKAHASRLRRPQSPLPAIRAKVILTTTGYGRGFQGRPRPFDDSWKFQQQGQATSETRNAPTDESWFVARFRPCLVSSWTMLWTEATSIATHPMKR